MNGKTEEDKKILFSHLTDLKKKSYEKNTVTVSDFLTESERAEFSLTCRDVFFWGGYEGAERTVAVFLPDWLDEDSVKADTSVCGIGYVEITLSDYDSGSSVGHRDVLGALMNLGIKREVLGDIVCDGNHAVFVAKTKMFPFLLEELKRVGRYSVTVSLHDRYDVKPVDSGKIIRESVSSMRLDGVVAAIFNLSRSDAAEAVGRGLVSVNGLTADKPDRTVAVGSRITLRGKGRAEIISDSGRSVRGRTVIEAKVYK